MNLFSFSAKKYFDYGIGLFLFILYVAINIVIIKITGAFGWDDGAITLAFGKTLGEYGQYSLNASSEIVEGSSSNFLVLLTALVTRFFKMDFYQIIFWSQLHSLLFTIGTLALTYYFIQKYINNRLFSFVSVFFLGSYPVFANEIMNGMEMTVFSFFLLLLLLLFEKRSWLISFCIIILLLIRYESVFYLLFSFFWVYFFRKQDRKFILLLIMFTVLVFGAMTGFRYLYFGEFLPNTIFAKMHYPYSYRTLPGKIYSKVMGGVLFFKIMNILILMPLFIVFYGKKNIFVELQNIKFWLIVSFFIGALFFGFNWGYEGRMFLAVLPILFIYDVELMYSGGYKSKNLFLSNKKIILLTILILGGILNFPLYAYTQFRLERAFVYQKEYRGLDEKTMQQTDFGVTPQNYRITGLAIEDLQHQLKLEKIKLMIPDVGGVGLSTENIHIIDIALLTNSYLAKNGYEKFGSYLEQVRPDVIETHDIWSEVTHVFENPFFRKTYVPIVYQNHFLWLRKDLLNILKISSSVNLDYVSNKEISLNTRYYKKNLNVLPPDFTVIRIRNK